MGVKISELQEKTSTNDTDVLPIVDAMGGTKKITVPNLLKKLTESISNIGGKVTNLTTYSTNEVKTGETWIDGKPIYRKVISKTVSKFSNTLDINLGTSNVDVFIEGRVLIDTSTFTAINHTATSTTYNVARWVFNKSTNKVQVYNNLSGGLTGTIYVIVEYTKTTD